MAGSADLIDDALVGLASFNVLEAVQEHDDAALFDWLVRTISFQGVADAVAFGYMEKHGSVTHADVFRKLGTRNSCGKLRSYWDFRECGYRKVERTCGEPAKLDRCPLPRHDLRNGHLNQAAYSLFLFMRDVAGGDLVAWLDRRLLEADQSKLRRSKLLADAVIDPLRRVYGVSDKVLNMTLSTLLLAGDASRERWRAAGASMVAVDTLVHNWLHRTGILGRFDARHPYGSRCYGEMGCAVIIRRAAARIDARRFNAAYPRVFPRFVQSAIWSFCAQSGLARCNGNRIDDRERCADEHCPLFSHCDRIALFPIAAADG